jgi:hypothetical protein
MVETLDLEEHFNNLVKNTIMNQFTKFMDHQDI